MSLETRLVALAQSIGTDIKSLRTTQGTLSSLNTTTKTSLVAAINELMTLIGSAGAVIDDEAAIECDSPDVEEYLAHEPSPERECPSGEDSDIF